MKLYMNNDDDIYSIYDSDIMFILFVRLFLFFNMGVYTKTKFF